MSYILNTPQDVQEMLRQIGVSSVADLFNNIPPELRLNRPLAVPPAMSEIELTRHLTRLAARNKSADDAVCFPERHATAHQVVGEIRGG